MSLRIPLCCSICLLVGCTDTMKPNSRANNQPSQPAATNDRAVTSSDSTVAPAEDAVTEHDATNTGRNVRDRDENAITADNQSESREDLDITAEIRRSITKDKSLSVNAHNVKIIAQDGGVTLRGPVDSDDEKAAVVAAAQRVAGDTKVVDELEVKESR